MATNLLGFKYGTQASYNSLVTKDANSLYFISDSNRIYKGDALIASNNIKNVSVLPEVANAFDGILYVVTENDKMSISILNAERTAFVTIATSDAVTTDGIATLTNKTISADNNTITDLIISNFKDGTVSTAISSTEEASDEKLVTEKAVATAIAEGLKEYDGAFVDVSASTPDGVNGTVLTFTPKKGEAKSITIADIFLAAASYDSTTHKLTLTLNDKKSSKVEVNLEDLINNTFGSIKVAEDEVFTVELGTGGSLGGYKTGDTIAKDTSLETVVKKLLMKQVPPTYTQPAIAIANNGGTASGNYEIGTQITAKIKATFTQNDAGSLTSIQFKKGSSNVGDAHTASPATYTEEAFTIETATSYSATATYAEGTVKKDNLGEDYPTGHIAAGTKTSSNYTYTPYRQGYFIGTTDNTDTLTSDTIRGLAMKKNGAYASGTVKLTVPSGAQRVIIACPISNTGMTKVINESALNANVTSTFTKSTIDVEGANGYSATTYNVWVFVPAVPYSQSATLAITLG